MGKLNLDQGKIARGRELAAIIVSQVRRHIDTHTTVSVERAVLRLLGIDGVDETGVPLVNPVVAALQREGVLVKRRDVLDGQCGAESESDCTADC